MPASRPMSVEAGRSATAKVVAPPSFQMERTMTYVVNDNCIKCKYTDCVEVCPVDCFYEAHRARRQTVELSGAG